MGRRKHVPLRTCIVCRSKRPKRDLIRIVRTPEDRIEVDSRGKRSGRGAYVCADQQCLEGALVAGRLARALKWPVSADDVEALRSELASLPVVEGGSLTDTPGEGTV